MVEARAVRRFRLAGTTYAEGAALTLPDNQFDDLAGCGLVEHAPAEPDPADALPATPTGPKKARR